MAGHVAVLGAGSWGTALSLAISREHSVILWARSPVYAEAWQCTRENSRYMPGVLFPDTLIVTSEITSVLNGAALIVVAVPIASFRAVLMMIKEVGICNIPIVATCKGFELQSNLTASQVYQQIFGECQYFFYLSGPTFSQEVATGKPCALMLASASDVVTSAKVRRDLSCPFWRLFPTRDVLGVELCGAIKNVLAIAIGICDGLSLGLNARAALLCFGLAEIRSLVEAVGANSESVMSLAGLGDLVLTATGDLSRNRQVGLALAQGEELDSILQRLGQVAEGVHAALALMEWQKKYQVSLPVSEAVYQIIYAKQSLSDVLSRFFMKPISL